MQPVYDLERPARFKPRHTNAQRVVMVVNILIIVGCLVGAAGLLYGKHELDNTLATEQVDVVTSTLAPITAAPESSTTVETAPIGTFPPADPAAVNFLITGSDGNSCADPGSPWSNAADPTRDTLSGRSDSIMVMRVDPSTLRAAVLSFPRDLWVKVAGANARINTAYIENDYALLAQTIYDGFGIVVDHYLQVDFCAFKQIVDAVGGVAVPFSTPIIDLHVGINIPAGCHTFSGDEALAYVRSRHMKWIDGQGVQHEDVAADLGRVSRQQDFLRRALQAALNKGIYDPAVATALIESMQQYIVRDSGMLAIDQILRFAGVMKDIDPLSIRTWQVDSYGKVVSGIAVQIPKLDSERMQGVLAIFQGTAPLPGAVGVDVGATPTDGATPTATDTPTNTVISPSDPTLVDPEENAIGDIVPDKTQQC